jgi:hypothetical protein
MRGGDSNAVRRVSEAPEGGSGLGLKSKLPLKNPGAAAARGTTRLGRSAADGYSALVCALARVCDTPAAPGLVSMAK